jgi:predicted nuclease of predicted toxin-antitoxin system
MGIIGEVRPRNPPYPKQKLRLYADENVPLPLVDQLRSQPRWRRRISIKTAAETGNVGRDDRFHFDYCRSEGLILVTLDTDFWNDRAFPLGDKMPALIIIDARSSDDIAIGLVVILSFISDMPFPNDFAGDSKFKVSNEGAVMRGRDARTRAIKTMRLLPGQTTDVDVAKYFGFLQP